MRGFNYNLVFNKNLAWSIQDCFSSVQTNILYCFDYPLFDFVSKFIEVDVILLLSVDLTIYVDCIFCNHAGKLDVQTVLTDSK